MKQQGVIRLAMSDIYRNHSGWHRESIGLAGRPCRARSVYINHRCFTSDWDLHQRQAIKKQAGSIEPACLIEFQLS